MQMGSFWLPWQNHWEFVKVCLSCKIVIVNLVLFLTCGQDDEICVLKYSEDTDNSKSHLKIPEFLNTVGDVFHSIILYGEVKTFEGTELISVTGATCD